MEQFFPLFFFFILLALSSPSQSLNPQYSDCAPLHYTCGTTTFNVSYPFKAGSRPDYCGYPGYYLTCSVADDNSNSNLTIAISNKPYAVRSIDYLNDLLNVVDSAYLKQTCPQPSSNTAIDASLYQFSDRNRNLTVYTNCSSSPTGPFSGIIGCVTGSYYRLNNGTTDDFFGGCGSTVEVPLGAETANDFVGGRLTFPQALQQGFYVSWTAGMDWCGDCVNSGGYCGYNRSSAEDHTCICANGTFIGSCYTQGESHSSKKVIIGVTCGLGGFFFACALCFYCYKRKTRKQRPSPASAHSVGKFSSNSLSKKDVGSISFHSQTNLFSYEELVEATNGFDSSKELGDGGYGVVFKGNLRDGRVVAVKRLYETSYKRVEQFMNEVEILSRLRHPNLVTLYGSTSPNSPNLLLVYEFVANGTLADHLHDPLRSRSLPLSLRLSAAIDTASALSYLHSVEVIHRDVKTQNILVDSNFVVKVADFGLSRLFPANATHVSTAPQGTPGYLDPEYHRFYQLTDKSDVYSFGVVLMELISSRPAVDTGRGPNEISLAMAAISRIQKGELGQLVDPGLGYGADGEASRIVTQMAELAFRCLQMDREMRPSIKEVLEVLREIEGGGGDRCEAKPKEEARLLKHSGPFSPDSVMNSWLVSTSTTPNTSA